MIEFTKIKSDRKLLYGIIYIYIYILEGVVQYNTDKI